MHCDKHRAVAEKAKRSFIDNQDNTVSSLLRWPPSPRRCCHSAFATPIARGISTHKLFARKPDAAEMRLSGLGPGYQRTFGRVGV